MDVSTQPALGFSFTPSTAASVLNVSTTALTGTIITKSRASGSLNVTVVAQLLTLSSCTARAGLCLGGCHCPCPRMMRRCLDHQSTAHPRRIFVRLALLPSHLKLTLEIMSFFTKHSYSSDRCRCCYSRFPVFVVVVFLFSIFFFCTFCLLPFNALQLVGSLLLPFAIQSSVVPGGDDDGDDN